MGQQKKFVLAHPGNIVYYSLVKECARDYHIATRNHERMAVIMNVLRSINVNGGGCFLNRTDSGWQAVKDEEVIHQKISQALLLKHVEVSCKNEELMTSCLTSDASATICETCYKV